jgi:TorA maturation chaperone TorD
MELFRALAVFAETPDRAGVGLVAEALGLGPRPETSAYTDLFVFQLYPYASVYLGDEGMLGGEARDRIAGFLKALGQEEPPREPDHLTTLLGAYAALCASEESADDTRVREHFRRARRALLWEHLLSWLPVYLDKLERIATPFYKAWAGLLREALDSEAASLGTQDALPLHLREARGVADPRESSSDEFLRTLLAPARSGLILVREDITRAARDLQTGVRAGERTFALRSLMGQDASATLDWLATEADAWESLHTRRRETHGRVAEWWAARAHSTAKLLRELRDAAADDVLKSATLDESEEKAHS